MIVTSDMRAAIRAAAKAQEVTSYADELTARQRAVDEFMSALKKCRSAKHRKIEQLLAELTRARTAAGFAADALRTILEDYGLREDRGTVAAAFSSPKDENAVKFTKAGGKFPGIKKRWAADHVIARVAEAKTDKAARAVLEEHGISWK